MRFLKARWLIAVVTVVALVGGVILVLSRREPERTVSASVVGQTVTAPEGLNQLSQAPVTFDATVSAWTGKSLLTFGLKKDEGRNVTLSFDPATGEWRTLADLPSSEGLYASTGVWTGEQLVVFGVACDGAIGPDAEKCAPGQLAAFAYSPANNVWTPLKPQVDGNYGGAALDARVVTAVGWSGQLAVFNLGADFFGYDPVTSSWTQIPKPPVGMPCATGSALLVVAPQSGGQDSTGDLAFMSGSGVDSYFFDSAAGAWVSGPSIAFDSPETQFLNFTCGTDHVVASVPYTHAAISVLDVPGRTWSAVTPPSQEQSQQPLPAAIEQRRVPGTRLLSYLNNVAWTGTGILMMSPGYTVDVPDDRGGTVVVDAPAYALFNSNGEWGSVTPGPVGRPGQLWLDGVAFAYKTESGVTTLWTYKP